MLRRGNPIQPLPNQEQLEHNLDIWEKILQELKQISYNASVPLSAVDTYVFVDEFVDNPNSTTIVATDQMISYPILATSIVCAIPATATGTLQIGLRKIPLTAGIQPGLANIAMIIYPQDIISVTSTVAGDIYLEIMGGRLMNDLWRKV